MLNFDDVVDENVRYVYKLCLGLLHDQKIAHQITHQTFWEFYDYFVNVKENMMFEELANIALRLVKSYNIELEGKGRWNKNSPISHVIQKECEVYTNEKRNDKKRTWSYRYEWNYQNFR